MRTLSDKFLFLFITFTVLGTIKIYIGGNLNWLIALSLLAVAVYFSLRNTSLKQHLATMARLLKSYRPMLIGWLLFMAGIGIAAAMNNGIGMYTIAKYLALLLVFFTLIIVGMTTEKLEYALTMALSFAVVCLLLFALFRVNSTLIILGDGRMGWVAIWPGVLWKVGAYVLPFSLWRCLKKPDWKTVTVIALALIAMSADGSRTSLIWLAVTWLMVIVCGIVIKLPAKSWRTQIALTVMAAFLFAVFQPVMLSWVEGRYDAAVAQKIEQVRSFSFRADTPHTDTAPASGTVDVLPQISKNVSSERLIHGNTTTRKTMMIEGWQQAMAKFPWGGGFGSTMVDDNGTRTVIHMTYLQILGDEGVLALAGYLLILIYPLYRAIRYLTEKRALFAERFELMLAPISVLALYILTGLLHPLSNEITEWAPVLAAIAVIVIYGRSEHVTSSQ